MRIAAIADVHSPRYFNEFRRALSECQIPDLLLLAGDMIESGKLREYRAVVDAIDSQFGGRIPIIACYGNEEGPAVRDSLAELVGDRVRFLDEEAFKSDIDEVRVGIVGVSTVVASPEIHCEQSSSTIRDMFERRIERLSALLYDLKNDTSCTILLMHYSPIAEVSDTVECADRFSWWVARCLETGPPDIIIHGHVHKPVSLTTTVNCTRVVNVAFPASGKITVLNV